MKNKLEKYSKKQQELDIMTIERELSSRTISKHEESKFSNSPS